jgi:hypothetical protein
VKVFDKLRLTVVFFVEGIKVIVRGRSSTGSD